MRIHSDIITNAHILRAATIARVDLATWQDKGSRSRDHAFDLKLEGESRRRPNGGASGAGSGYAATWDQWGVFLAELFAVDPNMVTPYYADAEDFATRTADRFGAPEVEMTSTGYVNVFKAYGWPEDAHGDHTFRWNGIATSCTKCSAKQRRS